MGSDWPEVRVEEIAASGSNALSTGPFGSAIGSKFFASSGVPVIRGSNLSADVGVKLIDENLVFVSFDKAKELRRSIAKRGDLVFTCWGTINQVGLIHDRSKYPEYVVSNKQMKLTVDSKRVDSKFLYYVFSSPEKQDEILCNGIGAAVPGFNLGQLKRHAFRLPPLDVQQGVVKVLDSLDAKIELNRRINQTLEAMAQAFFKSWFVDFDPVKAKIAAKAEGRDPLRAAMSAISGKPVADLDALPPEQYEQLAATAALFPDEMEESELGEIPKGWVIDSLSAFTSFQNGYAFKTKDWTDSGHPVVKIGNVKPGIIDLSGCSFVAHETVNGLDRFTLKRGDLLVGMTGYVGETGLVPALDSVAYLNQRVGRISTVNGINDIGYSFCIIRDPAYKAYAESKAHGSAQANVSGKDLMDYQAVVPDTGVLSIFNAQVAKMISALLSYHEESQNLAALRDTLLPKLLSGELPVDNIASDLEVTA